ncbi:DivIVA domain-containing protein [Nocardiopsis ansamitocini]|uniref:DivIVA domain-containing protein n=1 Tax=Nocardiopsis ansamitocini TaxID=1670832 RepID=A0A9W6P496_9ACTN|nr:DivIVA domain-containing protein [Nocardiopsis ansamitocini]GLU46792.1 hypothetical protein Nans01_11430 [Nocardiopsis ansamitocini]
MIPILILTALAALAVLAAVAVVVMGHGGQLARFEADHPPLELPLDRPVAGEDVARVRLPLALWGYHVRAVDEVLDRVASALSTRDARIAELESRLGEQSTVAQRVWYPRPPEEVEAGAVGQEITERAGGEVPALASRTEQGSVEEGREA